jgi:hypothetical protein
LSRSEPASPPSRRSSSSGPSESQDPTEHAGAGDFPRSTGNAPICRKGSDASLAPGPSDGRGRRGPVDYDDRYPAAAAPLTTTTTASRPQVGPPSQGPTAGQTRPRMNGHARDQPTPQRTAHSLDQPQHQSVPASTDPLVAHRTPVSDAPTGQCNEAQGCGVRAATLGCPSHPSPPTPTGLWPCAEVPVPNASTMTGCDVGRCVRCGCCTLRMFPLQGAVR